MRPWIPTWSGKKVFNEVGGYTWHHSRRHLTKGLHTAAHSVFVSVPTTPDKMWRTNPFHQDGTKSEEEAAALSKAKAKALKAEKAVLKGFHSHKKEDLHITHLPVAWEPAAPEAAPTSSKEHPGKQAWPPCHHQIPPDYWVSHEEDSRQWHTCVHCGC